MGPETGMAVFATAKDSAELLIFIIDTIRKVRRLRKECEQLGNLANFLQNILQDNKDALQGVKANQKLQSQLLEVAVFVAFCTKKATLVERAWEVIWEKRLPRMLGNMKDWVLYFVMDVSAKSLSKQNSLIEGQKRILDGTSLIGKIDNNVDEMKRSIESLKKEEESIRNILHERKLIVSMTAASWSIDFPQGNRRLEISKDAAGNFFGHLDNEAVVCIPISATTRDSRIGPRHVTLYSRLSANTLVHPFYGLADRDGSLFAVMRDLRSAEALGNSLAAPVFHDMRDRLRIAYDLAQTLAYLHSVEILVRSLSDEKVLLVEDNGRWKPMITKLDKARLLLEDTSDDQADVRYEAPEYIKTERHNVYTDVWSFGVLLWEWVSRRVPFETSQAVFDNIDPEKAKSIRQMLKEGQFPWKLDSAMSSDVLLSQVKVLVESCCHPNPTLRPPMASIAQSLFMILSCGDILVLATDQDAEGAKLRAKAALDTLEAGRDARNLKAMILQKDRDTLRMLTDQGDPVASALFGAAIWREMIDYQRVDTYSLISLTEQDQGIEEKARAALPFLDFAAQAGVKTAYNDLRNVHRALAELYHKLRK